MNVLFYKTHKNKYSKNSDYWTDLKQKSSENQKIFIIFNMQINCMGCFSKLVQSKLDISEINSAALIVNFLFGFINLINILFCLSLVALKIEKMTFLEIH